MKRPRKNIQLFGSKNKKFGTKADDAPKKKTQDSIVEAACEVFSNYPYYAASIRMVGKAAGIDHPLINYYFPTKADLFQEVLKASINEYYQANIQWLDGVVQLGPEKGFSVYIDRFIDFALKHPRSLRIIALNLVQAEGAEIIPGYQMLQDFFLEAAKTLAAEVPLRGTAYDINMLTTNFNTIAINYLGASTYYAGILNLSPQSPEYVKWVKDSLRFMIFPQLKQLIDYKQ